jgi:hypothetical protein
MVQKAFDSTFPKKVDCATQAQALANAGEPFSSSRNGGELSSEVQRLRSGVVRFLTADGMADG